MKNFICKLLFVCIAFLPFIVYPQLNYIGLKQNTISKLPFRTEMQIINGEIYVPTYNGIYKKNLNTLTDTLWQSFAFNNVPIKDFVKKGNEIIAITNKTTDSLLLKSVDNGMSYTNFTNPHFFNEESFNHIYKITQNPLNPNSILVLHAHLGIAKSTDFGLNYTALNTINGGYQDRFLDFHPQDTLSIYHGGETEIFYSFIQTSFDNGGNWNNLFSIQNDCTHTLAFHPTNPQIMLVGHEGRISKSVDKGQTWNSAYWLNPYIYVYKIIFNPLHPQTVYAVGSINGLNDEAIVLKSDNEGDSWHIAFQYPLTDYGGMIDMLLYNDLLILQTGKEGVFILNLNSLDNTNFDLKSKVSVFPNPASDNIFIKSTIEIQKIMIYDLSGKNIKNIEVPNAIEQNIDVSFLSKGMYLFKILSKDQKVFNELITIK